MGRSARIEEPGRAMADPIHQFEIHTLVPFANFGGADIGITNSAAFMIATTTIIVLFLMLSTASRAMVPGRLQSVAEVSYEFIANTIQSTAGKEGMRFFPMVFSLFTFILVANFLGMVPGGFTVTSHIIITATLALLVFGTVLVYGFWRHGFRFLKLFVPSGIPVVIMPLIVFIEVMSFVSRPISHSVRLFANMLAGHITLKVFASFIVMLGGFGAIGWAGATLPLALVVALTALEFLVAFLQAYVFTILTCIYLNDAIHPGH
ncbi:ATP synthase F0 sector subunit a [Blastochloris viridis]|uniref:ATP synthase subunit a n=2 Tax=Blastochloris viridis TaxID=1079 RepID=A0A182D3X6_BLAVI|nr:ATP synthase F0 sector subunit a [Blastochloris viridis]